MKLIDKEKVISAIRQYEDWGCPATGSAIHAVQEVIKIIGEMPTLTIDDLRPKGRWVPSHSEGYNPEYDLWFEWECSECHNNFANDEDEIPYNFCPNCGADMRGGGEG